MIYVCSLSEEGERARIDRNLKKMFSGYVVRQSLGDAGVRYLITEGREELFKTYVRLRRLNREMRAFLHCYGSSQMTEFYRSLGCFWPY